MFGKLTKIPKDSGESPFDKIMYEKARECAPWLWNLKVSSKEKHAWFERAMEDIFDTCDEEKLAVDIANYFAHQHDSLFRKIVEQYKGGVIIKDAQHQVLKALSQQMKTDERGVQMISYVGLTFSQMGKLAKFFARKVQDSLLPLEVLGIRIPSMFPCYTTAINAWKKRADEIIPLEQKNHDTLHILEWGIVDAIDFFFRDARLRGLMNYQNSVDVIMRGDAFPCGSGNLLLFSITLKNFGNYCKLDILHLPVNLADCNDKDRDNVRATLGENLNTINSLLDAKTIKLPSTNKELPFNFYMCSDDPLQRLLMGLAGSTSRWLCKYCYTVRRGKIYTRKRHSILAKVFVRFPSKNCGHDHLPLFPKLPWTRYKPCILHCKIAVGRILADWIHSKAYLISKENPQIWKELSHLSKELHLNSKFEKMPMGGWNLKACHVTTLFRNWPQVSILLKASKDTNEIIEKMGGIFKTLSLLPYELYSVDIKTITKGWQQIIQQFQSVMCSTGDSNYMHELAVEYADFLSIDDGLFIYSNDSTETVNCIAKNLYKHFSNHNGGKGQPIASKAVMQRIVMKLDAFITLPQRFFDQYIHKRMSRTLAEKRQSFSQDFLSSHQNS